MVAWISSHLKGMRLRAANMLQDGRRRHCDLLATLITRH